MQHFECHPSSLQRIDYVRRRTNTQHNSTKPLYSQMCNPGALSKPRGVKLELTVKYSRQIKVRALEDG